MKCDVPRHQFCVMRRQPSNRLPLVQGKACSQANELNWLQKDRSMMARELNLMISCPTCFELLLASRAHGA